MATLPPPPRRWSKFPLSEPSASPKQPLPGRICAWPWAAIGLILVAGLVLFYHLGSYRTFSSHEVYAVVPAREMIESRNWVFPTFGGLPRLRKPPLAFWIVAGSAKLCGELSPLTARLPSAFAGLLLAGLMGLWAKRWYGPRIGWTAMFVQLTSVWFLMFARKAEIDMVLCLFTTTALFLIADRQEAESRVWSFLRWLAVYVLLSLAWLAKFHYGPAMVLAPMFVYCGIQRDWRLLKKLVHPLGIVCFVSAIVIWPTLVLEQAPNAWEIWRRETIGRALGEMGQNPIWFYVPFLFWMPMPWLPFAVASFRESWRAAWTRRDPQSTLSLDLAVLAIGHRDALRREAQALSTGDAAHLHAAGGQKFSERTFRVSRRPVFDHPPRDGRADGAGNRLQRLVDTRRFANCAELFVPAMMLGTTFGLCQIAGWWFLHHRQIIGVVAANILLLMVGSLVVFNAVLPQFDHRVEVEAFAKDIRRHVLPSQPVCVFCMKRDPLVYHLGSPVFRVECLKDLQPKLQMQSPLYVVGYRQILNELEPLAETQALARLPKDCSDGEALEDDVLLVKLTPRVKTVSPPVQSANAN